MQLVLFELTSSSADSPARTLASQEKAKASGASKLQQSDQDCGSKCCGWCGSCDPAGFALRTSLRLLLEDLMMCSMAWERKATPRGRSYSVLRMSAPRTVGRGCGSWPTPRAEDSEQTGSHRGTPDTLTSASRLWASPQARDWKDTGPTQGNRKSPNLGTQCAGLAAPESHSTIGKPQDWPTQRSSDATGGPDPVGEDGMRKQGTGPDLKAVVNQEWPTPRANRHGVPDSHGKALIRGSLNPAWVSQLMGFPVDWLDSPPPTAAKHLKPLATQSAQSMPTTSGEQS